MMKLPEIRDALYRELAPLLPGWKLVKKDDFVRKIPGGKQRIVVPVVDYRPEYRFSLVLVTRLDAVQEITNQFSGARPAYHSVTSTSMTQLDYFFPGERPPKQYSVHDDSDIRAAVADLAPVIREQILPFLDRHQSIQALDAALNGADQRIDTSDISARTLHAVVLAYLADNPRFEELVARYQAELEKFPALAKSRERLAQLVEYLRSQRAS